MLDNITFEEIITIICAVIVLACFIKQQINDSEKYPQYNALQKIGFILFNGVMIIICGILFVALFTVVPMLLW